MKAARAHVQALDDREAKRRAAPDDPPAHALLCRVEHDGPSRGDNMNAITVRRARVFERNPTWR